MNGGSTSNRTPPHRQLPRTLLLIRDFQQSALNYQLWATTADCADENGFVCPRGKQCVVAINRSSLARPLRYKITINQCQVKTNPVMASRPRTSWRRRVIPAW